MSFFFHSSFFPILHNFFAQNIKLHLKTAHKDKLHFAMHNNLLHIEISFRDHLLVVEN